VPRNGEETVVTEDRVADLAKFDKEEAPQKAREWAEPVVFWVGVGVSLFHVYFNTIGTIEDLWTSALHFGMFGFLCTLLYPMFRTRPGSAAGRLVGAADVVLGLLILWTAVHLILNEVALYDRGIRLLPLDWVAAIVAILLGIEFTRRTTGWIIPVLIVTALSYVVWWGKYVTGVFQFPGLTLETALFRSYFSGDGMFGEIARISSTYVFMFILFGAFLTRSGAGDFIMNLARCAAGKMTGGPGLVAVMGSAMMGTISGSAVANVVGTGVITIPLMKRAGFPPHFAASVESSASTGGQIMPPIMGAGAFVMASYTQIPYVHIIAVSVLPAIMYFLSVGYWIRMEAIRLGIYGMEDPEAPTFRQAMRDGGHNLIPIFLLIGLLVWGFTPTYAAGISILAVIVTSWLSKNKMGPRAIAEALAKGARNMVPTAVLLVTIGLVVNVLGTTGIGNTFSLMISRWAGDSLLITILWVSLASIILGMGLPTTAAYIVLGTLSAPAIYGLITHSEAVNLIASGQVVDTVKAVLMLVAPEHAGTLGQPMPVATVKAMLAQVPPDMASTIIEQTVSAAKRTEGLLSAHMIIFWLAQFSNLTPPVCLAVYAACAIADSPPWKTGITAFQVGMAFFIIPLLFAYTPFLSSDLAESFKIFFFGIAGMYCVIGAIRGYMETRIGWPMRLVLLFLGVVLLWPLASAWEFVALGAFVVLLAINFRQSRRDAAGRASGQLPPSASSSTSASSSAAIR
jgi:TRAP transporter 4TM/12TM fusion protein